MQFHSYGTGFTLSNIRYMLIGQYAIVMFVVIVSVCISRQIGLIRTMQVGGKERTILVIKKQPASVIRRYGLLKTDLAKHPEIRRVTTLTPQGQTLQEENEAGWPGAYQGHRFHRASPQGSRAEARYRGLGDRHRPGQAGDWRFGYHG